MNQSGKNYSGSNIAMSFLVGGLVGAGVALLLAPKSGKETRKQIKDFTSDMKDKTADYTDRLKGSFSAAIDSGKNFFNEKKSVLKNAVESGKSAYEEEKENISNA